MINSEISEVSMHTADVAGLLSSLAESIGQLEAIFSYLQADQALPPRARALLGAGQELAGLAVDLADGRARLYGAAATHLSPSLRPS